MFTVIVFHDGRNDYLEQTLTTFVEQVIFPEAPHKILIDDMPDGRDVSYLSKLAARFRFDDLILNERNLGSFGSIMRAWSSLPRETDYVFHLENDFVFPQRVDVAELVTVLEEPSICNVTLLRQAWYGNEREAGGLFKARNERFREAMIRGIPVCLHQDYFGHNPGLYKREFARVIPDTSRSIAGMIQSHERIYRDLLIGEDPSRQFAILGRLTDRPRVLHIGHRRVGQTPDYEPGLADIDAQRLPSEPDQDAAEQVVNAKRAAARASSTSDASLGAILMYHRIATLSPDVAGHCVPPHLFREQMEQLAREYEVVSLTSLASDARPRRAVAITLDDGYLDAFTASDILSDLKIPVTLFVNSNAGGETFLDSLSRVLLETNSLPEQLGLPLSGGWLSISCATALGRRAAFDAVRNAGYHMSSGDRRDLLFALYRWSGIDPVPRPTHRMMTPGELREFSSRPGHSIGAHTDNHLWLPSQTRAVQIREIAQNRRYLADVVGRDITTFAYPYGASDHATVRICRALGFDHAVTTRSELVRSWDDPMLLPRVDIKSMAGEAFGSAMHAFWA